MKPKADEAAIVAKLRSRLISFPIKPTSQIGLGQIGHGPKTQSVPCGFFVCRLHFGGGSSRASILWTI